MSKQFTRAVSLAKSAPITPRPSGLGIKYAMAFSIAAHLAKRTEGPFALPDAPLARALGLDVSVARLVLALLVRFGVIVPAGDGRYHWSLQEGL